jgi:hypothetical protein
MIVASSGTASTGIADESPVLRVGGGRIAGSDGGENDMLGTASGEMYRCWHNLLKMAEVNDD